MEKSICLLHSLIFLHRPYTNPVVPTCSAHRLESVLLACSFALVLSFVLVRILLSLCASAIVAPSHVLLLVG
eukprot:m.32215 g.32215  ORF g.32215 m.32215 type:complete len:72 (+) comp7020_c0_seq1:5745-5960(+)